HLSYRTRQVGKGRIDVGVSDSGESARLAAPQMRRDFLCCVRPVTLPGHRVVREGEEEAADPAPIQVLAYRGLGPADLAGVGHGHEDLVGLTQYAQSLDGQQFGVPRSHPHPDEPPAHAPTAVALRDASRTSLRGNSGVAAQWVCR